MVEPDAEFFRSFLDTRRHRQYLCPIVSPSRDWHNHNVRSVSRTFGEEERMSHGKTAIVTESQQGIGAGLVEGFLKRGYCVVA